MKPDLAKYKEDLAAELKNILNYWKNFTIDNVNGGFVGEVHNDNHIDFAAPKGSVLNARILWSFSAAYNLDADSGYLVLARRAFQYIRDFFIDREFGGVYWLLDAKGNPIDTKKQVYAIAFTIYALSEYHLASKDETAKEIAIALYQDVINYSYDQHKSGYFEAFTRDWKSLDDLRLSEKDANEKKTMNTHLHVLEAFTTLYRIWPDEHLKGKIVGLIGDFTGRIIHPETYHLILFFDENWQAKSDIISYGHDIEASWLLLEAAEAIKDPSLTGTIKKLALKIASVTLDGIDKDGGLWYEYEAAHNYLNKEKHWWVQAESMVGFFNAWQISADDMFLDVSLVNWGFVRSKIIDHKSGEWFWGIGEDGIVMSDEVKVGMWKCPYHNSRACIEILKRISENSHEESLKVR